MLNTNLTVCGNIPVALDASGCFVAYTVKGTEITADTLAGLSEAMKRALKRELPEVAVPFTQLTWDSASGGVAARDAVATGIHGGTGHILTACGRKREQLSKYDRTSLRRFTKAEHDEYRRLTAEVGKANEAVEAFVTERRLDLAAAVREAMGGTIPE